MGTTAHRGGAQRTVSFRHMNDSMDSSPAPAHQSAAKPARRKPRYVLGTFWIIVAMVCFAAGFGGLWWAFLLGLACIAYAIYLYRGGRWGFFFF
jgi:hypothetical protein